MNMHDLSGTEIVIGCLSSDCYATSNSKVNVVSFPWRWCNWSIFVLSLITAFFFTNRKNLSQREKQEMVEELLVTIGCTLGPRERLEVARILDTDGDISDVSYVLSIGELSLSWLCHASVSTSLHQWHFLHVFTDLPTAKTANLEVLESKTWKSLSKHGDIIFFLKLGYICLLHPLDIFYPIDDLLLN